MPWFEPSISAPRYRAPRNGVDEEERSGRQNNNNHRNDDQIISLQDYLDVHWQADNNTSNDDENNDGNAENSSAAMQQSRINFDGFQHRVEHQLGAAVFPSVASSSFVALNSSLYQTNFNHSDSHHGSSDISGSRIATSFSKTAQFFHPRKVLALRQYEEFFSPLDANYCGAAGSREANQTSDECSENVSSNATTNDFGLNNSNHRLAVNEASGNHNIQIQPRNLFVSSQSSTVNDYNNHSATASGAHNDYNLSFQNSKKDKFLPSIQTTLQQDPATGQLASSLRDHNQRSNEGSLLLEGKASSWENYSGRPLMDGTLHGQSSLRESRNNVSVEQNEKRTRRRQRRRGRTRVRAKVVVVERRVNNALIPFFSAR